MEIEKGEKEESEIQQRYIRSIPMRPVARMERPQSQSPVYPFLSFFFSLLVFALYRYCLFIFLTYSCAGKKKERERWHCKTWPLPISISIPTFSKVHAHFQI